MSSQTEFQAQRATNYEVDISKCIPANDKCCNTIEINMLFLFRGQKAKKKHHSSYAIAALLFRSNCASKWWPRWWRMYALPRMKINFNTLIPRRKAFDQNPLQFITIYSQGPKTNIGLNNSLAPTRRLAIMMVILLTQLCAWRHQTITWTSVDLSLEICCGIHLKALSYNDPKIPINKTGLKIEL